MEYTPQELPPASAEDLFGDVIFEQDPIQILNAILPLYINGQVLRMLQESVASELGARMAAMQSASDNAEELADKLTITYNRARQVCMYLCVYGGRRACIHYA